MKTYSFAVANPADIDIDRILAENPEADAFVLTGQPEPAPGYPAIQRLIVARAAWLAQFAGGDNLYLGPEPLSSEWGWRAVVPQRTEGEVTFEVATEIGGTLAPEGLARFALTSEPTENIRKEFDEAQISLTHRRKITVEVLG